jgi:hypothetical protein
LRRPARKPLPQSRVGSQPQPWPGWTSTATGHSSTQGRWRLCECQVQPALDPAVRLGHHCPRVALRAARDTPNGRPNNAARTAPRSRRALTRKPTPSQAVDDLAPSQSVTVIYLQFCLVCKECPDRPREGKVTYDGRYRVPPSNDLLHLLLPKKLVAATITIRYRSQF